MQFTLSVNCSKDLVSGCVHRVHGRRYVHDRRGYGDDHKNCNLASVERAALRSADTVTLRVLKGSERGSRPSVINLHAESAGRREYEESRFESSSIVNEMHSYFPSLRTQPQLEGFLTPGAH